MKFFNDAIKAKQMVDELFEKLDANQSGKVDFSEFVAAAINKERRLSRQKIETSFKLFDLDGNGLITKDEIEKLFGLGGEINEELWAGILRDCDHNNDGMVTWILRLP
jgi:calcium-dependent protein kinase